MQTFLRRHQAGWKEALRIDGAKTFKRKALGLCGMQTVRTLDEMTELLQETGVASSLEEGEKIMQSLKGKEVSYGLCKVLSFDEVEDSSGKKAYRIFAYTYSSLT